MTQAASQCPICEQPLSNPPRKARGDFRDYECSECGSFALTGTAEAILPHLLSEDPSNRLRLRHALCWLPRGNEPLMLKEDQIRRLTRTQLPDLLQQAEKLILWLGTHQRPGLPDVFEARRFQAVVGSETEHGLIFVVNHSKNLGLLGWAAPRIGLSFEGWARYTELTRGARGSKRAFMAMQYGDPALDRIVAEVFEPAVVHTGFELVRLDQEPKAGLIDDNLRVEIRRSRFLIADLTHENRGAYWEAGFAEGLGKPVIYTCEKTRFEKQKPHFDTNHHVTVLWDPTDPKKTADDLKATIRATLPDEARLEDPS